MTDRSKGVNNSRDHWLSCSDDELIKLCQIQHFKATGPGGQHRNKVSSAVRLFHQQTEITVTATGSRNQHENRRHALRKLRIEIALKVRSSLPPAADTLHGFETVSTRNSRYPLCLAAVVDIFDSQQYDLKATAQRMEISASRLAKQLYRDPQVWQFINIQRQNFNLPPLRKP